MPCLKPQSTDATSHSIFLQMNKITLAFALNHKLAHFLKHFIHIRKFAVKLLLSIFIVRLVGSTKI